MGPGDKRTVVQFRSHFGGAKYCSVYIIRSPEPTRPDTVIPAKAESRARFTQHNGSWMPACAGMTSKRDEAGEIEANG